MEFRQTFLDLTDGETDFWGPVIMRDSMTVYLSCLLETFRNRSGFEHFALLNHCTNDFPRIDEPTLTQSKLDVIWSPSKVNDWGHDKYENVPATHLLPANNSSDIDHIMEDAVALGTLLMSHIL